MLYIWATHLMTHTSVQALFFKRAKRNPTLQHTQRRHLAAGAAGAACFALEDLFPKMPFIHATWHLLSTYGIATTEPLVALQETDPL